MILFGDQKGEKGEDIETKYMCDDVCIYNCTIIDHDSDDDLFFFLGLRLN